MNDYAIAPNPQDASAVKAQDFRTLHTDEAIRRHPDLANAYAVVQAAALVAEIQLAVDADRSKFTSIMKETVAEQIAQRRPLPVARDLSKIEQGIRDLMLGEVHLLNFQLQDHA